MDGRYDPYVVTKLRGRPVVATTQNDQVIKIIGDAIGEAFAGHVCYTTIVAAQLDASHKARAKFKRRSKWKANG